MIFLIMIPNLLLKIITERAMLITRSADGTISDRGSLKSMYVPEGQMAQSLVINL